MQDGLEQSEATSSRVFKDIHVYFRFRSFAKKKTSRLLSETSLHTVSDPLNDIIPPTTGAVGSVRLEFS